jgi:small-conductance mechanosensitive channel
MTNFLSILKDFNFWNNSGYDYVIAAAIFIGLLIVLKIFQVIILARLYSLAKKTKTNFDDTLIAVFKTIKPPFYFFIALYFGLKVLVLAPWIVIAIKVLVLVAIVYEIIRAIEKLLDYFINRHFEKSGADKSHTRSMVKTLQLIARVILWILGLTLVLANLGVNVTSLVASLGIGGLAVALALQSVLSDLFSSFSIYIDKPFQVGDFIQVGTDMGEVEKIGLKTTRIRTLLGEELIVSNKELTTARVQNFKRMQTRRESFSLGVVYNTSPAKLAAMPKMIEEITKATKKAKFDRCHFSTYGDSSLNFDIVYYIQSPDYVTYMDVKQQINLAIFAKFAEEKIEFAYPSQTIYLEK